MFLFYNLSYSYLSIQFQLGTDHILWEYRNHLPCSLNIHVLGILILPLSCKTGIMSEFSQYSCHSWSWVSQFSTNNLPNNPTLLSKPTNLFPGTPTIHVDSWIPVLHSNLHELNTYADFTVKSALWELSSVHDTL